MIQSYAMAALYGYGFINQYSRSPIRYEFVKDVTIKCGSEKIRFDMGMRPITLKRRNLSGNFQDEEQPMYLVEDDGVWKEYFSGTEVKCFCVSDSDYYCLEYTCKGWSRGNCILEGNGIREFVVVLNGCYHASAQAFANGISRYTDAEIKNMVGQFLQLKENAATWGEKFDKAYEELEKCYDSKNETASNKIADGMGKYANVQPGFSNEIILNRNPMQSASKDINEGKKSVKGIIVLLVVVIIVPILLTLFYG